MSWRRALATAAALALLAEPASALGRRRAQPQPSGAVLEARAQLATLRAPTVRASTCAEAPAPQDLTVVFAFDSDELLDAAAAALDAVAAQLSCRPDRPVRIASDGDRHGDLARQQALAERRAEQVRLRLLAAGLTPERVTTLPFGEAPPDLSATWIEARGRGW